jgi:hypothetical protein
MIKNNKILIIVQNKILINKIKFNNNNNKFNQLNRYKMKIMLYLIMSFKTLQKDSQIYLIIIN